MEGAVFQVYIRSKIPGSVRLETVKGTENRVVSGEWGCGQCDRKREGRKVLKEVPIGKRSYRKGIRPD